MLDQAMQTENHQASDLADEKSRPQGRVKLLLDVLVFQVKLAMDGIRDLVLIPISLTAAALGLIFGGDEPHRYFDRLLALGRRSDRFINLFDQHNPTDEPSSDSMLEPLKQHLMEKSSESRVTSRVSDAIDQLTDSHKPASDTSELRRGGS